MSTLNELKAKEAQLSGGGAESAKTGTSLTTS